MTTAELEAGNTHLRRLRGELLDAATFAELSDLDLDGLLRALIPTPYGADIEQASQRFAGLRCLYQALRTHLTRSLLHMRELYAGEARRGIDLLLTRWDVQNLLTLLRGLAAGVVPEAIESQMVAVGDLGDAELGVLARAGDLQEAFALMRTWGLPHRTAACALMRAWPEFETTGNMAVLEHPVLRTYVQHLDTCLRRGEPLDDTLRNNLFAEVDQINLLAALRLREVLENSAATATVWHANNHLPGGTLSPRLLRMVTDTLSREEVSRILGRVPSTAAWSDAIDRWVEDGDLAQLAACLWERLIRRSIDLFGDPAPNSIAIPIAYAAAKENEVRNLRLLGFGAFTGMGPEVARARLVLS